MNQAAFDWDAARIARDAGMQQAAQHADDLQPKWSDMALDRIRAYAASHPQFISEEMTDWAAGQGFVSPADPRAWGAPFQKAARLGIIRKVGYGISQRRHLSPTPLWQSLVA